ncbi:hypothetical protein CYMTET_28708 [Cymbomonas tetramitiformis]|uniref:J domain-containing protein n=1 Tax=Cymbomonas tetramitiformis TaxID=36881 RepID=A0AAE0FMZ9_9CHLO|nr:hypothetical protein CYMTET_28708 [Cymbomonas tetramitiformis]
MTGFYKNIFHCFTRKSLVLYNISPFSFPARQERGAKAKRSSNWAKAKAAASGTYDEYAKREYLHLKHELQRKAKQGKPKSKPRTTHIHSRTTFIHKAAEEPTAAPSTPAPPEPPSSPAPPAGALPQVRRSASTPTPKAAGSDADAPRSAWDPSPRPPEEPSSRESSQENETEVQGGYRVRPIVYTEPKPPKTAPSNPWPSYYPTPPPPPDLVSDSPESWSRPFTSFRPTRYWDATPSTGLDGDTQERPPKPADAETSRPSTSGWDPEHERASASFSAGFNDPPSRGTPLALRALPCCLPRTTLRQRLFQGLQRRGLSPLQSAPDSQSPLSAPAEPSALFKDEPAERTPNTGRDYYAILGVDEMASSEAIRKIYRQLALQLHPDKQLQHQRGGGEDWEDAGCVTACDLVSGREDADRPGAVSIQDRWMEVQEAYQILSDDTRRRAYDRKRQLQQLKQRVRPAARPSSMRHRATTAPIIRPKSRTVEVDVWLPPAILQRGGSRVVSFAQTRRSRERGIETVEKHFQLHIKKLSSDGDFVEYPGEGHEDSNCSPGDLRFVLRLSNRSENFQVRLEKEMKKLREPKREKRPFFQSEAHRYSLKENRTRSFSIADLMT